MYNIRINMRLEERQLKDSTRRGVLARLALFTAALIWGSSFIIVKNVTDTIPTHYLLAFRFTFASIVLAIIFCRRLRHITRDLVWKSAIVGLMLFLAYSLQTIGITDTTPGKNAFLTAVYCVITPFLFWIVSRRRPRARNFAAAFICIIGIGLVSLDGDFSIRTGDAFTLAGGFFFAAHIVAVARFSSDKDPVLLTILQFAFTALFSWIVGLLFEEFPTVWSTDCIFSVLYLAAFCTTVAMLFQNIGQKYTPPATAAILLTLEAVLGALFSVLFYGEQPTLRLCLGFVLIFIAVLISEVNFSAKKHTLSADHITGS